MDPLDQIPLARFQVELHTENPMWGFRVRDTAAEDVTYGFGLTLLDAGRLAQDHEAAARPPAWGFFASAEEANEWLEFDAVGQALDDAWYSEPDKYEEWRRWKDGTWS